MCKLNLQRIEKSKQHFVVAQLAMLCIRHDVMCLKQSKNDDMRTSNYVRTKSVFSDTHHMASARLNT